MSESMLPAEADNSLDATQEPAEAAQEVTQEAQPQEEVQELILGKFKTTDDVIKSYDELQKRFGGFTGAPEEYQIPEELDAESTIVSELREYGKKHNMNQEAFNEMLAFGDQVLAANTEINKEAEMEALGPNAEQRLANIDGFLRNNLGDKYEEMAAVVNNAKTVELIESLIKSTAPSKLPSGPSMPVNVPTQGDIERMMTETDPNGRILYHYSEAQQKKVQDAIAQMHGH